MSVITLSKEYAADGEVLARALAERLRHSILDKELIAQATLSLPFSVREPRDPAGDRQSRLLLLIDHYTVDTIQKAARRSQGRLDDRTYFEAISQLVRKAALEGDVIITGWGGQCILAEHPGAVHVRVVKHIEERIAWLKDHKGLDRPGARSLIDREEKESAAYIEHYFNRAWDDPHLYHTVLNLSKFSLEQAVEMVIHIARVVEA